MNTLVLNQTQVFLIFIFCGALVGLLFDVFRILRKSFKTPDFITYIEDILFWMLTCFLLAYALFQYNNGEIRAYLFIGLFIGITLYILLLSKYIIKISLDIITVIKKVAVAIFKFLAYPLKIILSIIRKMFLKPVSFLIINVRRNLSKQVKKFQNITKKAQQRKDFT